MALNKTFKGISTVDNSSKNYRVYDEELIKRDLLNSFMERPGERLMLGKRGCKIWNMLFEGLIYVLEDINDEVIRIIKMEKRVTLVDSNVIQTGPHGIQVQATIKFDHNQTVDMLYIDFQSSTNDIAN